jgi:5,10-methylene-tetrahydrofolate dehydrogenase/methenyl tetrahydrofolate cyclohydrolase
MHPTHRESREKERSLGRAQEWLDRAVFLDRLFVYTSPAHLDSYDQELADEAVNTLPDIPPDKLIAWQAIAAEMDAQFRRATSAMREQLDSVPKIVEVAYTNSEFRKIDEDCFQEVTDLAKSIGVVYEIDKLYVKDGWESAEQTLRDRVSKWGADPSVDGIQVHASYFGGRERPFDVNWIDPLKDIDCLTTTCNRWLLNGRGWLVRQPAPFMLPSAGAILRVLRYGLAKRPLAEASVALLKTQSEWHSYASYPLTVLAVALRCRSVTTCVDPGPDDANRIRCADAIISQVDKESYLDGRYVRQGQVVIDLGGDDNWQVRSDADLDSVIPLIGAYANKITVGNLKLRISFLNAMRSFLWKQNRGVASRLMPLIELV